MRRCFPAFALLAAASAQAMPAAADEFTDVLGSALEAYEAGDIEVAQEELDYAQKLLGEMKAATLARHLPPAPPGWTRDDADPEEAAGAAMAMAMFGGGATASATYRRGSEDVTLTLVASSAMATGIGAMISGMAGATGGRPIRIQRVQFTNVDGELQGVVDGRVMVSATGSASLEDKQALIEAMDLRALGDF